MLSPRVLARSIACTTLFACASAKVTPPAAPAPAARAAPRWEELRSGTAADLRGLSVVSDRVAWASGTRGTIVRTTDGGAHWTTLPIRGAETLDFRGLRAFDERRAVAMSSGTPARIYRTLDGGARWELTYEDESPKVFLDAVAFFDERRGLVLGDPVDGRFLLLATSDGGATWHEQEGPSPIAGEAAFAASNSCLVVSGASLAWFATGGSHARVFRSHDGGASFSGSATSVTSGTDSAGIFSLAVRDAGRLLAVGGDYKKPGERAAIYARSADGGATWDLAPAQPGGYRSAIALSQDTALAVGPTGTDLSRDGGATWSPIDAPPLNSVALAQTVAFAVGPKGLIVRMTANSLR